MSKALDNLTMKLSVDTSDLDEAIRKATILRELTKDIENQSNWTKHNDYDAEESQRMFGWAHDLMNRACDIESIEVAADKTDITSAQSEWAEFVMGEYVYFKIVGRYKKDAL